MHFSSNEETVQWIKHYVDWETAVARQRDEDRETASEQEQEDLKNAGNAELITRKPENTFEEMLNLIGDSLSHLAWSNDDEDEDDEEDDHDDPELGKPSEDVESGWVIGTNSKTVQHRMEKFRQNEMKLELLTQLGRGDTAYNSVERDTMYGLAELKVPAIV